MSSIPSPDIHSDENETTVESTKQKRLPRSAKKRLRYERLREQRKLTGKKKKKRTPSNPIASIVIPSDSSEILTDQLVSVTGKTFKRAANDRLAEINRDSEAPMICIDCAYNESMSSKEIASLARQIGRCYSSNRRATKPVRLILTNWSNDSLLAQECRRVNNGFDNYQIILDDKPIYETYPSERLIYLSPNGDKILTEVNEQTIHVIGGLVDESVRKNMTYQSCQDKNITCCKLPIETYMEHSVTGGTFNQILSINQVFDILVTYMTTNDWGQTLKKNIPERKGWVIKNTEDSDNKNKIETV
ncbi:unnamed protein product [Adineta steineri]|uniref:SAM-dependent MTase TRM10-type domain-containing protein n=1 Tax=Adineta steineri TaxID=433720 RepID=A0A814MRE6_9BILA|nr:unnamed protein product [Adineta steineri]CAF1641186.1 unnamed protein product [Adineta steineri]